MAAKKNNSKSKSSQRKTQPMNEQKEMDVEVLPSEELVETSVETQEESSNVMLGMDLPVEEPELIPEEEPLVPVLDMAPTTEEDVVETVVEPTEPVVDQEEEASEDVPEELSALSEISRIIAKRSALAKNMTNNRDEIRNTLGELIKIAHDSEDFSVISAVVAYLQKNAHLDSGVGTFFTNGGYSYTDKRSYNAAYLMLSRLATFERQRMEEKLLLDEALLGQIMKVKLISFIRQRSVRS